MRVKKRRGGGLAGVSFRTGSLQARGPVHVGDRVPRPTGQLCVMWSAHVLGAICVMWSAHVLGANCTAGYACNARPDLHTVCRSFPKISADLSAKFCGGSRSAKRPSIASPYETVGREFLASLRTSVPLSVQTLLLEGEARFSGVSASAYCNDVDAVEVITIPFWHYCHIATVSGEKCAGCVFDHIVLPGNEYESVPILSLFNRSLQTNHIRIADARVDGQAKSYRSWLYCRERPDVVKRFSGIYFSVRWVGSKDSVGPAESFGDD